MPAFEARCIRPAFVALPRRTAVGTPRSCASAEAAHRPSRCTASSATAPWRPVPGLTGSARRDPYPSAGHSSNRTTYNLQECPPASSTPPHRLRVPGCRRSSRRTGGRPPGLHSRKIPAFEDRCIPADFVARPHRTAVGTPRSCASPVGAHRPSRCTASSGTEPETPGGTFREGGQAQTRGFIASRAMERAAPLRGCGARRAAARRRCDRTRRRRSRSQAPSSNSFPCPIAVVSSRL